MIGSSNTNTQTTQARTPLMKWSAHQTQTTQPRTPLMKWSAHQTQTHKQHKLGLPWTNDRLIKHKQHKLGLPWTNDRLIKHKQHKLGLLWTNDRLVAGGRYLNNTRGIRLETMPSTGFEHAIPAIKRVLDLRLRLPSQRDRRFVYLLGLYLYFLTRIL